MELAQVGPRAQRVIDQVETVIVGKTDTVRRAIVALFCSGHLLIEDVPGTGKTMLARALARSLDCTFKRIQFTPDLLPSDITGTSVFNQKSGEFVFKPGPVFANIVLADEINRATPKTQSSLLECMEEFQVSVDGVTHELPAPFFVIATQNNIEHQGTYPLPEAQLDRFVMRVGMGYPSKADEIAILDHQEHGHPIHAVHAVMSGDEVMEMKAAVRGVRVGEAVREYIVELVDATRHHSMLVLGASPRAALDLLHSAQALAALRGRPFVLPDDAKELAISVLAHRLIVRPEARLRQFTGEQVVQELLDSIPIPVEMPLEAGVRGQGAGAREGVYRLLTPDPRPPHPHPSTPAMKLTTLTVSTAFILIVATLLNIDQLYAMAGMLAALPLVCYFVGRRQNGGVSAMRRLDPAAVPGRSLPVSVELKNTDAWPKQYLLVQDHLPAWLARDGDPRPILATLAAHGTDTVTYRLRPEKRGCFQVGPLEITATDPLGIFHFQHQLSETAELLVYPQTVDLPWIFPAGGSPYGASATHAAEMRGEGSEFYGIREYQPGDPLRRVHWRSSARMGRLAVVEYEHDLAVDLTLVLDARRGSEVGHGVETTLETAVTIAASLAQMVLERGNRCRLVIPGLPGIPTAGGTRGGATLHTILDALARVQAEQTETAADGIAAVLPEIDRDSTVALITSVWDAAAQRAVTALTDAGMAAMVVYVDPESFRVASLQAGDGKREAAVRQNQGRAEVAGPVGTTVARLPAPGGEAVRAQIEALRARPVIIHGGLDLSSQFTLALSG